MSLATYNAKRHFGKTSEPEGKKRVSVKQRPLVFVVQKHQASHLHYDFRLELDGVLKSWAVPKGPSLNPADRRLARMVEDHPFDYRTFEGTIPAGEYGAGTVMVWDQGPYAAKGAADRAESEKQMRAGLAKGHLRFVLDGAKLKGEFSLVRMHGEDDGNWLLIKKQDAYAVQDDVLAQDTSAVSGRDLEGIAQNLKPKRKPKAAASKVSPTKAGAKPSPLKKNAAQPAAAKGDPLPRDIKPMMATLVDEPFERSGWLFELKFDGYRAIAEIRDKSVRLYSRRNQTVNDRYGPVVEALQTIDGDAVLDGEITVVDAAGHTRFELLQNYHRSDEGSLVYFVFDLLYYAGHNLMQRPLRERKGLLQQLLPQSPYLRFSEHNADGLGLYKAARKEHLEGIIAKDGESPYEPGARSLSWLKIKAVLQQEAVIGGFTQPRRSRKLFGALVLGVYEGDELVYIGHTGGGFDQKELKRVHDLLQPLVTEKSPFKVPPHTNTPVTWVKPKLVVEVKFSEWTKEQIMRQPIYLGMRTDKSAREVTREKPKPTRSVAKAGRRAKAGGAKSVAAAERTLKLIPKKTEKTEPVRINRSSARGKPAEVELTHPDKVLWPDEGYTKQDLFDYYESMAPLMLLYLRDRPQSLHRFPNGIDAKAFFQKNVTEHPEWVESVSIPSSSGDTVEYVLCQDKATLLYLANLACIEINPWNARVSDLDKPDWLVIDLDPLGVGFKQVVAVAKEVHRVFDQVEAECFCKTSGATGLHIFAPVGARYETKVVVEFARLIAYMVHDRIPDLTSVERSPSKRQHCVYLDFLQNNQGQTLAAPYSLRPRPGATVSTPLKWSEVRSGLDPTRFTIRTIQKRLDKVGDLWKGILGKGNNLEACLQRLQKLSKK